MKWRTFGALYDKKSQYYGHTILAMLRQTDL
jgi:hypothetical protein